MYMYNEITRGSGGQVKKSIMNYCPNETIQNVFFSLVERRDLEQIHRAFSTS